MDDIYMLSGYTSDGCHGNSLADLGISVPCISCPIVGEGLWRLTDTAVKWSGGHQQKYCVSQ